MIAAPSPLGPASGLLIMFDRSTFVVNDAIGVITAFSRQGLSQRRIADLTGLKKSTVFGLLHGQHRLSPARAATVAPLAGKSPALLVELPGETFWGIPATARDATLFANYNNAKRLYGGGDRGALAAFKGKRATFVRASGRRARVELPTDDDVVQESLYADLDPYERYHEFHGV
jgi:hypothetical protein